uniref:Uncharacterized protein n=1 Tax=Podoviridae sp. ctz6O13 TaxID=2827757 RepID=A0A8S5TK54_9CAUD|nr:MAG TPA: hypothetical protein [Podoviridae sp. ctz6O13]
MSKKRTVQFDCTGWMVSLCGKELKDDHFRSVFSDCQMSIHFKGDNIHNVCLNVFGVWDHLVLSCLKERFDLVPTKSTFSEGNYGHPSALSMRFKGDDLSRLLPLLPKLSAL